MSEHVHDWRVERAVADGSAVHVVCNDEDCPIGLMNQNEMQRRIRASEHLRAIDATDAAFAIHEKKMLTIVVENLEAYATALDAPN